MGLAAFNRARRIAAKKKDAARKKGKKPLSKYTKSELIAWLKKNKGITIADPKLKTIAQLLEMTTMTFGDMVNDPAVNKDASKEPEAKKAEDPAAIDPPADELKQTEEETKTEGEEPLPPADDTEKTADGNPAKDEDAKTDPEA